MNIKYLSRLSDSEDKVKKLFSNEYILTFFKKFCKAIQSRIRKFRKAKNANYGAGNFLRGLNYSEIT